MERQKEITLHEIHHWNGLGKPLSGITPSPCKEHYSTPTASEEKKPSSTSFLSLKKSVFLFLSSDERPRALLIMGNESLSASGVDVSHDVEQKSLLSLRLHMNILETAERPAEKMSAE